MMTIITEYTCAVLWSSILTGIVEEVKTCTLHKEISNIHANGFSHTTFTLDANFKTKYHTNQRNQIDWCCFDQKKIALKY